MFAIEPTDDIWNDLNQKVEAAIRACPPGKICIYSWPNPTTEGTLVALTVQVGYLDPNDPLPPGEWYVTPPAPLPCRCQREEGDSPCPRHGEDCE